MCLSVIHQCSRAMACNHILLQSTSRPSADSMEKGVETKIDFRSLFLFRTLAPCLEEVLYSLYLTPNAQAEKCLYRRIRSDVFHSAKKVNFWEEEEEKTRESSFNRKCYNWDTSQIAYTFTPSRFTSGPLPAPLYRNYSTRLTLD